jgi:hypothetical protein
MGCCANTGAHGEEDGSRDPSGVGRGGEGPPQTEQERVEVEDVFVLVEATMEET